MLIKLATEEDYEQIHRLNYKTFVEEIPQHEQNESGRLVDKFHAKNKYIIAVKNNNVVGMVCYNTQRPFSLDAKIKDLDNFLPPHKNLAEARLLAVEQTERKVILAYRLLQFLCAELIRNDIDAAVISGTTRQLRLYQAMGFVPFGPLVGKPNALYQPMFITVKNLRCDFKNS